MDPEFSCPPSFLGRLRSSILDSPKVDLLLGDRLFQMHLRIFLPFPNPLLQIHRQNCYIKFIGWKLFMA